MEIGFDPAVIEVHPEPQHLYGHMGDERPEVAHVIIRRQHVGRSSNDIGFLFTPEGCQTIISDFDAYQYGKAWLDRLQDLATVHKTIAEATSLGLTVRRQKNEANEEQVVVTGYR